MRITVLGSSGFIGSQIVKELRKRNIDFVLPERNESLNGKDLGKIIYCIGLTGDAKKKPFETIDAHVNKLSDIIRSSYFNDITYASSTRIYIHDNQESTESGLIPIDVLDPFELFNLTKLLGESLLINTTNNYKSVRYSNVYGNDVNSENFLTSIIADGIKCGKILLHTTSDSAKDFISVEDAARLTVDIAISGKGIYNVASGVNTTNKEITDAIAHSLGCEIEYATDAKRILFPVINNEKVKKEFQFRSSSNVLEDIPDIIETFMKVLKK
jgi:nucleoside-diphosphate-sugar epimerase